MGIHRAQEALIETTSDEELENVREQVRSKVKKVAVITTRKNAIQGWWVPEAERLLHDDWEKKDGNDRRKAIRRALEMRNRYWENEYHEAAIVAGRVSLLVLILMTTIVALILLPFPSLPTPGPDNQGAGGLPTDTGFLAAITLFGLLGGTLSSLLTLTTGYDEWMYSDHAKEAPWHLARPLIGAASALVVVAVISTGIAGFTATTPWSYYGFATVAGFSEVFLVRLMKGITPDKAKEEKEKEKD